MPLISAFFGQGVVVNDKFCYVLDRVDNAHSLTKMKHIHLPLQDYNYNAHLTL